MPDGPVVKKFTGLVGEIKSQLPKPHFCLCCYCFMQLCSSESRLFGKLENTENESEWEK